MINIAFKKPSYSLSFLILFFLAILSNVSATSINGLTLETGHANTNQATIYERWANTGGMSNYVYDECGWSYFSIGDMDFGKIEVANIVLMESELKPGGAEYQRLAEFKLEK